MVIIFLLRFASRKGERVLTVVSGAPTGDFVDALRNIRPSVAPSELRGYAKLRAFQGQCQFGSPPLGASQQPSWLPQVVHPSPRGSLRKALPMAVPSPPKR